MKKNKSTDNLYITTEQLENYLSLHKDDKELKILGLPILKIYHENAYKSVVYLFNVMPLLTIEKEIINL